MSRARDMPGHSRSLALEVERLGVAAELRVQHDVDDERLLLVEALEELLGQAEAELARLLGADAEGLDRLQLLLAAAQDRGPGAAGVRALAVDAHGEAAV